MPTKPTSDADLQQAIDWCELYGSGRRTHLALGSKGLPAERTIDHRCAKAILKGMRPTVRKDAPRIYERKRLGKMHIVIPDIQAKSEVPIHHLEWIGNYIVEKKPDVIVQIGDFADMPSLSSYDRGKREAENKRYMKDIAAVRKAQELLLTPLQNHNRTAKEKYTPRKVITKGNHEYRITREIEENPRFEGRFSEADLGFEDYGWEVHDFLEVVKIDGVEYSHYFTSGQKGNPVSSAAALLRERQCSATQGHAQYTDMAIHKKTQNIALFCGIAYLHNERYLGPQGNTTRRQIIVKHEVEDGRYDPMFVSLKFLEKNYS
jgi:hypothetical protein